LKFSLIFSCEPLHTKQLQLIALLKLFYGILFTYAARRKFKSNRETGDMDSKKRISDDSGDKTKLCKYGEKCYRKNPVHFK
jgi:hypothetical protein